jgi:hypothetical protein
MKATYSVIGLQVDSMLEGIADDRDAQVAAILQEAKDRARELVLEARADSRRRLRETIREERGYLERRIQHESAALATAAREHRLKVQRERLERGSAMTREALLARWQEPAARREWLEGAIEATEVLEPGPWQVACATGLDAADEERLVSGLAGVAGERPTLTEDEGLEAGVVVTAPDVRLDLSVGGLLRDRARIEGLLLQTLIELEAGNDEVE